MSPLQLSFRAARAQRARAPPSSRGGTGPLCRPTPALGTSQELIQFPFGLFAAVTVAPLQLADEFSVSPSIWFTSSSVSFPHQLRMSPFTWIHLPFSMSLFIHSSYCDQAH